MAARELAFRITFGAPSELRDFGMGVAFDFVHPHHESRSRRQLP